MTKDMPIRLKNEDWIKLMDLLSYLSSPETYTKEKELGNIEDLAEKLYFTIGANTEIDWEGKLSRVSGFTDEEKEQILKILNQLDEVLEGDWEWLSSGGGCYHIFVKRLDKYWLGFHNDMKAITITKKTFDSFDNLSEGWEEDWEDITGRGWGYETGFDLSQDKIDLVKAGLYTSDVNEEDMSKKELEHFIWLSETCCDYQTDNLNPSYCRFCERAFKKLKILWREKYEQ